MCRSNSKSACIARLPKPCRRQRGRMPNHPTSSRFQPCQVVCNAIGHLHGVSLHKKMDGRKFDWIRKQLGLSKVELAKRLGISRQSLYRCIWDGPPKLVALAILGLWYQDRMGGLLEEASEPEEQAVQKPRGKQGNRRSNKKE